MLAILAALTLALTTFPTAAETAWMDPEAFHLNLGMPKRQVMARLKNDGLSTTAGKEPNHLIVQYEDGKTITLAFEKDKLDSARFEYVGFIPSVKKAFAEQEKLLARKRGQPSRRVARPVLLTWDEKSPNISLVVSTAPNTSFGRQGLGFLVVRYFTPTRR